MNVKPAWARGYTGDTTSKKIFRIWAKTNLTLSFCRERGGCINPGRRYGKQFESNPCRHNFILPPGIQHNHPDLAQNYDPFASTDINDSDQDPMPQVLRISDKNKDIENLKNGFQDNGDNKHGTRCAGEVAAVANNGVCGVGIAYNASIG